MELTNYTISILYPVRWMPNEGTNYDKFDNPDSTLFL
jgi:hypothetical protein